jgi:hypothetical protein
MKKIHPKVAGEQYEENEEGILVYRSAREDEDGDESEDGDEAVDPRWQILKNLPKN